MKLGYLGPKTNSENAAKKYATQIAGLRIVSYLAMEDVFNALKNREVDRIIVPVKNSITGDIDYQRQINMYCFKKTGELSVRIKHCIAAKNKNIPVRAIISHVEALKQCRDYLDKNYCCIERIAVESTNEAAKIASFTNCCAAISNLESCLANGLNILERNIIGNNFSTFWILKEK